MGADLSELLDDWVIHLRATGKRPRTIDAYRQVADDFLAHLRREGLPTDADRLRSAHVEHYLASLSARVSPGTVAKSYRHLQQLCRWLTEEGEVSRNPMERMRPPRVPQQPVPVLSSEDIGRVLSVCKGAGFEQRRDMAIFRILLDTGMRSAELLGMTTEDVDRHQQVCWVMGKGGRGRVVPFGAKTAEALSRYLRERSKHPRAATTDALWIGHRGPLTDSGLRQMMERRGREAGVPGLHPHRWRHTFAHLWLAGGGQEQDLMNLAGWRSREMVARYGASAATMRAHQAHRRLSLGDKF